ncbi:bifunctional hydroxymethylpyrimidine kinase/phosphomethylpyrimidine kinase [Actinomycetospora flava]|uniref:Bifunctional hydroxymethylpyrimidine kinase/phosphomethylpyrimidine kinase n=1 Tax=Actinomycetospora flava TaxID=3129232 RepID=A0ABU8M1C9_9PSEU
MSDTPPVALAIAGTDSGGGAGLTADVRAFTACGVHGAVAVAAVTVQNSVGVQDFHPIPPEVVAAQIRAVAGDMGVDAAKTGMLASTAIITAVVEAGDQVGLGTRVPFVVDPVAASMHGHALLAPEALEAVRTLLIPRATLVTPNLDEVRLLVGVEVVDDDTAREAARALLDLGAGAALVKGGHLEGSADVVDLLVLADGTEHRFTSPRRSTEHTHGGGDSLASSITAGLARGMALVEAVALGKAYITRAVEHAYPLGAGHGPVSSVWSVAAWERS